MNSWGESKLDMDGLVPEMVSLTLDSLETKNSLNMVSTVIPKGEKTLQLRQVWFLRLRGGMMAMPNNNQPGGNSVYGTQQRQDNLNINNIEGLSNHNGIPQHFFIQTWWEKFKNGLIGKTKDGYVMLSVYEGLDQGGPQWVINNNALPVLPAPPAVPVPGTVYRHVLTPFESRGHDMRNSRLLQILAGSIDIYAPVREDVVTYGTDGYSACRVFVHQMHIPNSPNLEAKLENMWSSMSVESLNLSINRNTLTRWATIVLRFAKHFDTAKTKEQIRTTFFRGLPVQMMSIKNQELMTPNPNFRFPAAYPANSAPGIAHPSAGNAHPFAGQFDVLKFATHVQEVWTEMIRNGSPEAVEREEVRIDLQSILADVGETTEQVLATDFGPGSKLGGPKGAPKPSKFKAGARKGDKKPPGNRSKPKEMTKIELGRVCIKCGGIGHQAVWKLKGGGFSRCRTFNTLPDYILKQLKYPHLGNITLEAIRQRVYKGVPGANKTEKIAAMAVADVSEFVIVSGEVVKGDQEVDDEVDKQLIGFLGDMEMDEDDADDDDEGDDVGEEDDDE